MKRFLTSIVVSIVFITIGITTLFFEFDSFKIIDVDDTEYYTTVTYNIDELLHNEEVTIVINDSSTHVTIEEDAKDKDTIKIEYPQNLQLEEKRNTLEFDGYSYSRHSYGDVKEMIESFIDGLKDKKIYLYYGYTDREVIIHCSPENRKLIQVNYD